MENISPRSARLGASVGVQVLTAECGSNRLERHGYLLFALVRLVFFYTSPPRKVIQGWIVSNGVNVCSMYVLLGKFALYKNLQTYVYFQMKDYFELWVNGNIFCRVRFFNVVPQWVLDLEFSAVFRKILKSIFQLLFIKK